MSEACMWATEGGMGSVPWRGAALLARIGTAYVRFTTEVAATILAVFSMLLLNNELKTGEQASPGADLPRVPTEPRSAVPERSEHLGGERVLGTF